MTNQQKQEWIEALGDTIQIWKDVLNRTYRSRCPLCIKARRPRNLVPDKYECEECIHLSSFGQKKICTSQRSYVNAKNNRKAISYRMSYLRKIQNKLLKSMK